ncbi:MAG: hypothetical protein JJU27_01790 [Gammaproteobacteria bacterium]|nr:hypothetical protein [Gammaproteobacteria bacterium]
MNPAAGFACVILAGMLAGCGTTSGTADARGAAGTLASAAVHHDCVRISRVRRFERLDDSNLLLFAPDRQNAYHVQTVMGCPDIGRAGFLSIDGAQGSLCGYPGEVLRTGIRTGFPGDARSERPCQVRSVRRLDFSGLQDLLVEHGLGEQGEPAAGETEQQVP